MLGRRSERTGGVFVGYIEDYFGTENDEDGCRSFVAVERSMSQTPKSTIPLDNYPSAKRERMEHCNRL
ncbi:hypothetical protein W02_40370 [Nitrospira sp. KM1]|nr:hypothetical protein W02_40370 [Nitrospira sp. KM1]